MLVQISTVKARLNLTDSVDDAMLTNFIKLVSGRFEQFCNRKFERVENATFEFQADSTEIIPDRLPIESISTVELKRNEVDGWVEQTAMSYLVRHRTVISLVTRLGREEELGRFTYTGGFVLPGNTPEAGQTALPDEIEQACAEQVAYCYQNRDRLGLVSMAGQGGAIHQFAQLDLLPFVKEVLKKHERYIL